jgi:phage gpG-like protein
VTDTSIQAKLEFPPLGDMLANAKKDLRVAIAAAMQTNRGLLFDQDGGRNGHKSWAAPLLRVGQPMSASGTLRNSMGPNGGNPGPSGFVRFSGDLVSIGTALAYADTVCHGATITAAPGHALAIPLPMGKRATDVAKELRKGSTRRKNPTTGKNENVIFRKSVTIPAREFDLITSADEREILGGLEKKIVAVLS